MTREISKIALVCTCIKERERLRERLERDETRKRRERRTTTTTTEVVHVSSSSSSSFVERRCVSLSLFKGMYI